MKKILIPMVLVFFVVALSACSSDGDNSENNNENTGISYAEANFDISLPNISGDLVNVSPDGKTMYAYFTGVS